MSVEDLLKRMRDSGLPKLGVPRRENFFPVSALPYLGSGKLDLKQAKETALKLVGAAPGE
jgi:acyl-[acyl-carrier-protein]-phospholipid O-acyltransferase/long-chain-fatty-acid--[acyl-carrier-protein] ligase